MTFASSIIRFFNTLNSPSFSNGVEVLNPYKEDAVKVLVEKFYHKYFDDNNKRFFIIGINPGRFGGGLTGIAFTDPVALRELCGIDNRLSDKKELSSRFIYSVIEAFGGVGQFYEKFYLTALYPLAIVNQGKNYNYYDDARLFQLLKPSMIEYLQEQVKCGAYEDVAICLGKKNFAYVDKINREIGFFKKLLVVEHPRYIMQYKVKQLDHYIEEYLRILGETLKHS